MKVICKGYKTCEYNGTCSHAKPHDFLQRQYTHMNCKTIIDKYECAETCRCSVTSLRKYKLEKLKLYEK